MSEHTKEPWFYKRTNWKGEPSEHDIYISGDQHEGEGDPENDEEPTMVATSVCIVIGNSTSGKIAEATARRIVACVNACRGMKTRDLEAIQVVYDGDRTELGVAWDFRNEPGDPR